MSAEMWAQAARAVAPRERPRPSQWAAENVTLAGPNFVRPGPFNPGFLPWIRPLLDALYEEPHKRGIIGIKRSQVGFTVGNIVLHFWEAATQPGPQLYVFENDDKAKELISRYVDPVISASPTLRDLFAKGGEHERQVMSNRSFRGGHLDFVGAGSQAGVTGSPRRRVTIDEYENSHKNFRSTGGGDLFAVAEDRTKVFADAGRSCVSAFGHPGEENKDIHKLYLDVSDQRTWRFDCPKCGGTIDPKWSLVFFDGAPIEEVKDDRAWTCNPTKAALRCPNCGEGVSDAERARAVWEPDPDRSNGGSGRFEGDLAAEVAARRGYIGLWPHGLADPSTTLASLADKFLRDTSPEGRMAFYNKTLGEPYAKRQGTITWTRIKEAIRPNSLPMLPGGPRGVHYLSAGVDVQKDVVLYTTVMAWAGSGHAYAVAMHKLQGWAALYEFLRTFRAKRDDGNGRTTILRVPVCGVDHAGAWAGEILGACRQSLYHVDGPPVKLLPVKYASEVKADEPWKQIPLEDSMHPDLPHLPPIERYKCCRDVFVRRTQERFRQGRVTVVCEAPPELLAHVTANAEVTKPTMHGQASDELVWRAIKGMRDDWARSMDYAEIAAVVKLKLDLIHTLAVEASPAEVGDRPAAKPGEIQRSRVGDGGYRRWTGDGGGYRRW